MPTRAEIFISPILPPNSIDPASRTFRSDRSCRHGTRLPVRPVALSKAFVARSEMVVALSKILLARPEMFVALSKVFVARATTIEFDEISRALFTNRLLDVDARRGVRREFSSSSDVGRARAPVFFAGAVAAPCATNRPGGAADAAGKSRPQRVNFARSGEMSHFAGTLRTQQANLARCGQFSLGAGNPCSQWAILARSSVCASAWGGTPWASFLTTG